MSSQILRRRGSTAAHSVFVGGLAELTVDTDKDVAVIHDGVTAGGFPLAGAMFSNIFSRLQTITPAANESALAVSGASLTGANAQSIVDVAGTWNTTGIPTALKVNITDTASNTSSLLIDLQRDGISRFFINKGGFGQFLRQEADTSQSGFQIVKRGTTGNALAALSSGSGIGTIDFLGWDGAAFGTAGNLRMFTTEAWAPGAHGSKLFFLTTPNGSVVSATRMTLDSTALTLAVPLDMGTHLINNVVNPVAAQDAATKSYVDGLIAAGTPPFIDSTALVKGSADPTKLMRFEVDGFTAATTRVLTPPDADITLAGINIAQTFAATQTFSPAVNTSALIGSGFSLTGANAQSLLDLVGTWNTSGNPTAIKLNITNTASGASSKLLDLQVGAVSKFSVSKDGYVIAASDLEAFNITAHGDLAADGDGYFVLGDMVINSAGISVGVNSLATPTVISSTGGATFSQGAAIISAQGAATFTGMTLPYAAKVANYTITAADYTINATSGTFTITLPTAVGIIGRIYVAKNSGVGTITLDGDGAELIDGSATATIVAGAALMVQSTGAGWIIL